MGKNTGFNPENKLGQNDYRSYRHDYTRRNKSEKLPALHRYSIVVFALLFFAYLVSGSAAMEISFFDLSGNVVYRGQKGIALICPMRWDAKAASEIMESAEEREVPLTFFVTADWASRNAETLAEMLSKHAVGILGSAQSKEELQAECAEFARLGLDTSLYMHDDDSLAHNISRWAEGSGMKIVLSSFDILSKSSSSKDVIERVDEAAFDGAIIRFEPTGIMKKSLPEAIEILDQKGFDFYSLPDLLGENRV